MTIDEDEAIARTCGCGQFDEEADDYWYGLTPDQRLEIGKREAAQADAMLAAHAASLRADVAMEVPF